MQMLRISQSRLAAHRMKCESLVIFGTTEGRAIIVP